MFSKKSRYAKARPFSRRDDGSEVFGGVRPRRIAAATGVIEHMVRKGDRLDLLARHYYNDDRLWWRIADANPEFMNAGDMLADDMQGRVILIPAVKE